MPIPQIQLPHGHRYHFGEDPARFLVDPGDEFFRPYLAVPNGPKFVWPVGTEGFTYGGSASLGIHKYIGEDDIEANVIYLDEPRITMNGTFPGHTGVTYMRELQNVIALRAPDDGKILYLPFVFPRLQYVIVENYNFEHDQNDRTRSIGYTITFLKVGVGRRVRHGEPDPPDENPVPDTPSPPTPRFFRVRDGYRTLHKISTKVYKKSSKWNKLYRLNKKKLDKWAKKHDVPHHKLPNVKLPLGMKLQY